jgi:hypothetical protein
LRQAPQLPKIEIKNDFFNTFLLFLLATTVLVTVATLYFNRPDYQANLPTMQEVIWEKTATASQNRNYNMVVEESGPGYNLRFNGLVENGRIYGKIDSYDLEIYTDQETYFVKGSGLIEEWQEMGKADLDALSAVVRDPLALLETILSGKEILVEEGPERMVEDITCQTYFLELPPPEVQMFTRFEEEATLDKLQLYLWFDQKEVFLHRIAILMSITIKDEVIQINRIYSLNPQTKEMPEDIPRILEGFIAI